MKQRRSGTPQEGQFVTPAAKGTGHVATIGSVPNLFSDPELGNFALDFCKGCMHD